MNAIRTSAVLLPFLTLLFPFLGIAPSARAATTLIPLGATWKYLDDGSNQGTAWRQPGFNDSAWRSGCAQLGYGDGDECTRVGYGPDPQHKYITTYFRREFVVANASQFLALSVQLLVDDGAVLYLNGVEIFRENMPAGTILYNTLASRSADENLFVFGTFCATPLVEGTNVLTAEVHQVSPSSSDISFDLNLEGLTVVTPDVRITQPEESARFAVGTSISVSAAANEACGSIRTVEFYDGTTKIGQSTTSPFQFTWSNAALGSHTLTAVATNEYGSRGTSAPVYIRVLLAENSSIVAAHSVWKYLDDGSDQGTAWRNLTFNDSAWKQGPAELGYGDADEGRPEATVVGYGPDPGNKYITTYFRQKFVVTNVSFLPNLVMHVLRDDGVVVYLNGVQVFSSNMDMRGPVNYQTLAFPAVTGAEETNWVQTCLVPNVLVNGTNIIAAEIHQVDPTSTDISFDLELLTGPVDAPKLNFTRSGNTILVCWPRGFDCYALETTDRLSATPVWQPVTTAVSPNGSQNCVFISIAQPTAFYRLKLH